MPLPFARIFLDTWKSLKRIRVERLSVDFFAVEEPHTIWPRCPHAARKLIYDVTTTLVRTTFIIELLVDLLE